jgi:TetR/AcrR family transcriptional regulator, cholesterol catabolism regulator
MITPPPPRPAGRRELQRRETERLIIDAALRLFVAHGFDATTTKQIALAAGVAHGTVFLVAATKEALLVKVLEARLREVVAARTATLPRHGIVAQLVHLFDGLFAFYAAAPGLARGFLRSIMFPAEPIAQAVHDEHVARFSRHLAGLIDQARARGELAGDVDPAVAATNVLALYVYAVVGFLNAAAPELPGLRARFRAGLDAQLRGLAVTAGRARRRSPTPPTRRGTRRARPGSARGRGRATSPR